MLPSWILPWLCLPSLGLSFPFTPKRPCPHSEALFDSRIHRDRMGDRAIRSGRPGPEGCLLPLPQPGLPGSQVLSPSPQLPGAPVLCLSRSSSPPSPASERLRNHLSLDLRGRAEEGQTAPPPPPAHGHPLSPSPPTSLSTRPPPPQCCQGCCSLCLEGGRERAELRGRGLTPDLSPSLLPSGSPGAQSPLDGQF